MAKPLVQSESWEPDALTTETVLFAEVLTSPNRTACRSKNTEIFSAAPEQAKGICWSRELVSVSQPRSWKQGSRSDGR